MACIIVLVAAIMLFEVPAILEACFGTPEGYPDNPYSMGTCLRTPPLPVAVLKLVIALLAISGASVIAARGVSQFKVVAGATAATISSFFGLVARNVVDGQIFKIAYMPSPSKIAMVGCAFFLFGALVAWATERWWPNRSIERVHEG
jgi:hypothetical protein